MQENSNGNTNENSNGNKNEIINENGNDDVNGTKNEKEITKSNKSGSLPWLYVLSDVLGGFALASLLAFEYIKINKKSKNNNSNNNNNNSDNNDNYILPPSYSKVIQEEPLQRTFNNNLSNHSEKSKFK